MKYWKLFTNNPHVAKYIECYWFLEKEPDDTSPPYPKLNPDPSTHLILSNDGQTFQYDQEGLSQKGNGSYWLFPHRNTFTIDHSNPFQIIGIKFKVGALYSLTELLSENACALELVEPMDSNQLAINTEDLFIGAVEDPQRVCNTLDESLAPWLFKCHEDKHSELVRLVLPLLSKTPIAQIGRRLHRSQRTIERSFLRVTDLTLKQCQTMIRLEELLNYLYKLNSENIDWIDLAVRFEFSDQPHLIRHLKNSIGKTPEEYARQRDLTIDIYGDFEF